MVFLDEGEALTDHELARRCVRKDPAAWAELVRHHVDAVYRMVSRVLGSGGGADVEDVVQSVFLKLWENDCRRLGTFQGKSKLSTWLVAVSRREALDFAGRRKRPALPSPDPDHVARLMNEMQDHPVPQYELAETRQKIQNALAQLPTRDQLLMRLIYYDNASYNDAARMMRVPLNSISPWVGRAKERLKVLLTTEEKQM